MTPRVVIVIPAHNRRDTTLACLRRLCDQGVLDWAAALVVDDGSTDGTSDAIRTEFPQVEVIAGDGHLFWTGAIETGMQRALEVGADFIFWLNDDCEPAPTALATLLAVSEAQQAVTGGVCTLPRTGHPVYGGFKRGRRELEFLAAAPSEIVPCDALNGNLVCFPRAVVEAIGLPDCAGLPHASGDTDYTLRARARGFPVLLVGNARATATPHNRRGYGSWLCSGMTAADVWATLGDPRAYGYFPADIRFRTRHWGVAGFFRSLGLVLKRVPVTLAILLVPLATRRRRWGARSAAWQAEQLLHREAGHE